LEVASHLQERIQSTIGRGVVILASWRSGSIFAQLGPPDRRSSSTLCVSAMIKRVFDIVVATCAILVTWPLILLGAIATTLASPGPAFYRSKRAGLRGRPFNMFKLRTMRLGADTPDRKITAAADDRISSVGRL